MYFLNKKWKTIILAGISSFAFGEKILNAYLLHVLKGDEIVRGVFDLGNRTPENILDMMQGGRPNPVHIREIEEIFSDETGKAFFEKNNHKQHPWEAKNPNELPKNALLASLSLHYRKKNKESELKKRLQKLSPRDLQEYTEWCILCQPNYKMSQKQYDEAYEYPVSDYFLENVLSEPNREKIRDARKAYFSAVLHEASEADNPLTFWYNIWSRDEFVINGHIIEGVKGYYLDENSHMTATPAGNKAFSVHEEYRRPMLNDVSDSLNRLYQACVLPEKFADYTSEDLLGSLNESMPYSWGYMAENYYMSARVTGLLYAHLLWASEKDLNSPMSSKVGSEASVATQVGDMIAKFMDYKKDNPEATANELVNFIAVNIFPVTYGRMGSLLDYHYVRPQVRKHA